MKIKFGSVYSWVFILISFLFTELSTVKGEESTNVNDGKKKDIAILYICIGKYDVLWKEFYDSMEEKFIPFMSKDYYVFTDSKTLYAKENDNVHVIEQKNLGWPGNTLYRFHMFLSQKEELQKYKYIFFMNANAICLQEVGEEFLPKDEGLLFVQHPGFYKKKNNKDFTYERNVNSTAYIPMGEGTYYVQGSVNGGKANDYLHMCEVLKNKIDEDDKNGIVAVWHDESHLNKYIVNLEPNQYKLLNISYNYAHYTHDKLYEPKIYLRKKDKYFDVSKVKSNLGEVQNANFSRDISKIVAFLN